MTQDPLAATPRIARAAIAARLAGEPYTPPALDDERPCGVFVTLTHNGALRGCIGHIGPVHARLSAEVADVAVSAALRDPRFPPLRADELRGVDVEVSVLTPPAPCEVGDLDPRRYGVVVTCGSRRGVLLPDLEGVDAVDEQLRIALRKAGIGVAEPWRVQRFEVRKYGGHG